MFEECSLLANDEDKLIIAMGFNFADLTDQIDGVSPTQIPGQLAGEEACVEQLEIVADGGAHTSSMALAKT